jgi:hypothetical protein
MSYATLTVSKSTLQTTTNKDNSLYAPHPLTPASSTQCLLLLPSTHPTNHLMKPHSSYPHDIVTRQPQSHSPPVRSKPHSNHNPTSTPPYSKASQMASCKPSPIRRPAPVCPTNSMKTDSAPLNSASSTTRTPLMNPQLATHLTTEKFQTSTSQWATGCTKRPSGFTSTMMGLSRGTTACRGPTSSPTSLIYMQHLTTASTPPLRCSWLGSDICSQALAGISKFYSKLWPIWTIGAWPARSCDTANSTTTSWRLQSRSSSTSMTLMPFEHGSHHVSPALCSPMPPNGLPCWKTSRRRLEWYIRDGREVVAHHTVSMSAPCHWRMRDE